MKLSQNCDLKRKNSCSANKERAASLVEYGLLVSLIAVVCLGAVRVFGANVSTSFSQTSSSLAVISG